MRTERGASLIEVLVAMVILAVGLLGLVVLQGRLLGKSVCHTGSRSCFVDVEDGATRLVRAGSSEFAQA